MNAADDSLVALIAGVGDPRVCNDSPYGASAVNDDSAPWR